MGNIGFVADVGTTFIDTCLIDTSTGKILSEQSIKNGQSLYGSDVITRIKSSSINDNLNKLRNIVLCDIMKVLSLQLEKSGYAYSDIKKIVMCGNTTMISIILGLEISSLGEYPFTPLLKKSVEVNSCKLWPDCSALSCKVFITGCASAFIGGDVLAGLIHLENAYSESFTPNSHELFIDLGTNGEMLLCNGRSFYSASAACGPAFENSTRRQGVYASGTFDAIMLGYATGKIKKNGALEDAFLKNGIIINGVQLTSDIIRDILLAKSAIYSGILCLLKESGLTAEELDTVYVAGGFGFYLNIKHAIRLGLFPKEFEHKIIIVGNTSLKGGCDIACKPTLEAELDRYTAEGICNLELADMESYKTAFIDNMIIGSI